MPILYFGGPSFLLVFYSYRNAIGENVAMQCNGFFEYMKFSIAYPQMHPEQKSFIYEPELENKILSLIKACPKQTCIV